MLTQIKNQKGSAIWTTLAIAIVCAIAAYGALFAAQCAAQRSQFHRERTRARYAAEGGLVWAQDQLWADQRWLGAGGVANTVIGGTNVSVFLPACALPAPDCERRTITVNVSN